MISRMTRSFEFAYVGRIEAGDGAADPVLAFKSKSNAITRVVSDFDVALAGADGPPWADEVVIALRAPTFVSASCLHPPLEGMPEG
jgi:hypothetical protein